MYFDFEEIKILKFSYIHVFVFNLNIIEKEHWSYLEMFSSSAPIRSFMYKLSS